MPATVPPRSVNEEADGSERMSEPQMWGGTCSSVGLRGRCVDRSRGRSRGRGRLFSSRRHTVTVTLSMIECYLHRYLGMEVVFV